MTLRHNPPPRPTSDIESSTALGASNALDHRWHWWEVALCFLAIFFAVPASIAMLYVYLRWLAQLIGA